MDKSKVDKDYMEHMDKGIVGDGRIWVVRQSVNTYMVGNMRIIMRIG